MQHLGFVGLLGWIPLLSVPAVVVALLLVAVAIYRYAPGGYGRSAAALYLSGIAFCAVSFAIIPPVDPPAFYHQRYVLPGAMAAIAAIPLLLDALTMRVAAHRSVMLAPVFALVCLLVAIPAYPSRVRHLANDARNIDDVQVAFGRELSTKPPSDVVWAVDAGAIRFFGAPFVVDMIGLNTPSLLGPSAQSFLDAHPPAFLDVFPGWSRIEVDVPGPMPVHIFEATTRYTVTSAQNMRAHALVTCSPPQRSGRFIVRARSWSFRCSS
jgi:hypothetical protein